MAAAAGTLAPAEDSRRVVGVAAAAMMLASADRTVFSVVQLPLASQLGLAMSDLGVLQSAFLCGYGLTQLAGGAAADALGGARVLVCALALWSLAVLCTPLAAATAAPVAALAAARFAFGAFSGVALPSASAAVAASVPSNKRAGALAVIFATFNSGSATGLLVGGAVLAAAGWKLSFVAFGGVGLAAAVVLWNVLPPALRFEAPSRTPSVKEASASSAAKAPGFDWVVALQVVGLTWCHVAVNWGFFILQAWLPVYLAQEVGLGKLAGAGAALPWALTAVCAFSSGKAADWLLQNGWDTPSVRRLMMAIATLGPALSLVALPLMLPLVSAALGPTLSQLVVLVLLMSALGLQAVSVAGFHAYVQDVAPARAGALLGLTNTCGVVAGIVANLFVGRVLDSGGSFAAVFYATAGIYLSSFLVWMLFMRGRVLFPLRQAAA